MAPGVLYRVIFGTPSPPERQKAQIKIHAAVLDGYERHKVKFADYPGIIKSEGASVKGTYVTGLTSMNIIYLDTFEGDDYDRVEVQVKVLKRAAALSSKDAAADAETGQEVDRTELTEAYVFKHRDDLEEGEWDFDTFTRDKLKAWTLEDREDFEDIEDHRSNDGTRGRGGAGSITAKMEALIEDETRKEKETLAEKEGDDSKTE